MHDCPELLAEPQEWLWPVPALVSDSPAPRMQLGQLPAGMRELVLGQEVCCVCEHSVPHLPLGPRNEEICKIVIFDCFYFHGLYLRPVEIKLGQLTLSQLYL